MPPLRKRKKPNPKSEWRAPKNERLAQARAFNPRDVKTSRIPGIERINWLLFEVARPGMGGAKIEQRAIELMGRSRAREFIKENAKTLASAYLEGFKKGGIVPLLGFDIKKPKLSKKKRNAIRKDPAAWAEQLLGSPKAKNYTSKLSHELFTVFYKLAEKEWPLLRRRYGQNALVFLEHRGYPVAGENGGIKPGVRKRLERVLDKNAGNIVYFNFPLAAFERQYLRAWRFDRAKENGLRELAGNIARETTRGYGLSKAKPGERAIIDRVKEDLLSRARESAERAEKELKTEGIPGKKEARGLIETLENSVKEKKRLASRAETIVKRELERRKREELLSRAGKGGREAGGKAITRKERIAAHGKKAAAKKEEKRGGKETAGENPRRAKRILPLEKKMRDLKRNSPELAEFIEAQARKGGIKDRTVSDILSKVLQSKGLVQRAAAVAIKRGFVRNFPAEAMPAMLYSLTALRRSARREDSVKRFARNACKKTECSGEFVDDAVNFLLKRGIIEEHHSDKGRGRMLSISRHF